MTAGKPACLLDGTPIDTEHFNIYDRGLPLTPHDHAAIVRAERALEREAPYAIAAATRRRLLGVASGEDVSKVAQEIRGIIREMYGDKHKRTAIALVANFYPDVAMTVLQGTNARSYLATVPYPATDFATWNSCVDLWTKQNATSIDEKTGEHREHANRRILLGRKSRLRG